MQKFKSLFILLVLFLLVGCSSLTPPLPKQIPLSPPVSLLNPCITLPSFTGGTMGDLVSYNINLIQLYGQCSLKLINLQKWVEINAK